MDFKGSVFRFSMTAFSVVWLLIMNYAYWYYTDNQSKFDDKVSFAIVLVNLVGLSAMLLPHIMNHVPSKYDDAFLKFIKLPEDNEQFTFPVLSGYLGEQALGAFLSTFMIYTTTVFLVGVGPVLSAIYCFVFFSFSLLLVVVSSLRFIWHFANIGKYRYIGASLFAAIVMLSFLQVGIELAPKNV